MKAAKRKGWQQVTPIPFLNLDPIACLTGHSNEALVIIIGQEVTAFIDSGAQVLSISAQFCKELTLQNQPLGWFLELEGRGCSHPMPQICGGKPPDSRDKKLQQGCAAVCYPHHNLLQYSSGHGGHKAN